MSRSSVIRLHDGDRFDLRISPVRKGLDAQNDAFAAGDYVETWKVRCGRQNRLRSGDDEFSEYEIVQKLYPLVEPAYGQIVA